jgi:hypothetical protein
MSKVVFYIGPSGSGKSSGARTLDPKSTFIFNVLSKDLPWKGSARQFTYWEKESNPSGNMIKSSDSKVIVKWLEHISKNMPHIKDIVIDDNTFVTALELQKRREEAGWNKFSDIAQNFLDLAEKSKSLRDDLVVHICHHTQSEGDGILENKHIRAMSYGKLIDEKLGTIEAQFSIVLFAKKEKNGDNIDYVYYTKDSDSSTKAPFEMFPTNKIPNDMAYVRKMLDCYYNDDCVEENKEVKVKTK